MKRSLLSAAAAIAVLAVAACGGGGSSGGGGTPPGNPVPTNPPTSAPTSAPSGAPAPASMPQLATVAGAQAYVSSSNQHTLYTFAADKANTSNCTDASGCTGLWPPYTAPAGTVAPSGSGFGLIKRSDDGQMQWTYQQIPLYNYAGDSAAGQDNGQGINSFGGIWGTARPASASPGPTSSPSHCVGYYC